MTGYLEIMACDRYRRLFAEYIAGLAAAELGIPTPRIRFFAHGAAPDAWSGQTWTDERVLAGEFRPDEPGTVWVLQDLPRDELAKTVAHECAHAAWHIAHGSPYPHEPSYAAERAANEAAARDFASQFMRRLYPRTARS